MAVDVIPDGCPTEDCQPCWEPDMACCDEWDDLSPELQTRATALAWSTIRVLSGGRAGNCPTVVRPCLPQPCSSCAAYDANWWGHGSGPFYPRIRDGVWVNNGCPTDDCACSPVCEVVLPGQVAAVNTVLVDGVTVSEDYYRVDNGNRIVFQWDYCPCGCQSLNKPLGANGTFGISYTPGIPMDAAGLWAVGVLACEFSKACQGGKCRLPSSVSTISRQGVSMTIDNSMFSNGMTGIREVDAWLMSVNPYKLLTPPRVWSPDIVSGKHRYSSEWDRV